MPPDPLPEELMRRFLVDDVTVEKRDRVEAAFARDADCFDALCALEGEMILTHLRGELSESWSRRFEASLLASPARRARVAEMRTLLQALPSVDLGASATPAAERGGFSVWSRARTGLLVAGPVAAIIVGSVWLRQSSAPPVPGPAAPLGVTRTPQDQNAVTTFVLVPNSTRAAEKPRNAFRVPDGVQTIRLHVTVPGPAIDTRAELRPVGGASIAIPRTLDIQSTGDRTDIFLEMPSALLPRGDYLLTLDAARTGDAREPIARRFFSIEN